MGIVIAPILLMLLAFLVFGAGVLGMGLLGSFIPSSSAVNIAIYLVGFVLLLALFLAIIIIQFWSQVALIFAIKDSGENIGIKESYKRGWRKIRPFIWVSVLSGLMVMSGYIFFVIPGIVFAVWFTFAAFIVVAEDLKGMDAILKSREYVRNYWWQVLWRLLFLTIVIIGVLLIIFILSMLVGSVSSLIIGRSAIEGIFNLISNFASIIIAPLTVTYSFLIYKHLREIKGDFEFKPSAKAKKSFIAVGVLGILAIVLVIGGIIFAFSTIFSSLDNAKSKAMDVARRSDLSRIKADLLIYYDDKKEYPKSLSELGINYIDPETKKPYEYRRLDNGGDYEICVQFKEKGKKCFSSEDSLSTGLYNDTNKDSVLIRRDEQRLLDLNLISTMLWRYKQQNGNYPVSPSVTKLNENNNVVREIKSANYNMNIPVDSNDPEYYYGYRSTNGKNFELTARLENTDNPGCDPEIRETKNICIYVLKR